MYQSPAKLNLFFRVLRKRGDGFHEIASLFAAIDLFDTLDVVKSDKDQFACSDLSIENNANLVIRARDLFRHKTGIEQPLYIKLTKRIPMYAGLGGGSGNAATMLWALNELFDFPLSLSALKHIAAEIGSDVPFFLSSGLAFCQGRGEELFNVARFHSYEQVWVAKPKALFLSTPKVYQAFSLQKASPLDPHVLWKRLEEGAFDAFINDLEVPAMELLPELSEIKKSLQKSGFQSVCMTGSGTSFFCFGEPKELLSSECDFWKVRLIERQPSAWYGASEASLLTSMTPS